MNFTAMLRKSAWFVGIVLVLGCSRAANQGPYFATGIKIGEVSSDQAIVWTRLTRAPRRVGAEAPLPQVLYRDPETGELSEDWGRRSRIPVVGFREGSSIEWIEGAAPGSPGRVRLLYRVAGGTGWQQTDWHDVDPDRDFTHQFRLTELQPGTSYELRVESSPPGGRSAAEAIEGRFRTAPAADQASRVVFTVSTGQAYPDQDAEGGGYKIYPAMLALDPDFFVHTGDILYYDRLAKTEALARWHWARMYSLPTNLEFHRRVASYFIKDDHDTWMNDCWPGQEAPFMGEFTFEQGQAVFLEQVPMGERTWRSYRWGSDLEVWLVEGRDHRSPNPMPDGPDKTIWGAEQKAWFKKTAAESDATFRILISPTPIVGPDRENKQDNHSNSNFQYEGNELRSFLASQERMFVACGDRHWQYVSEDLQTGLREYSCGPASDQHAGGWSNDMLRPEHRYLNVVGGFLSVTVESVDGIPTIIFRHHAVDGSVLNEERHTAL